MSLNNSKEDSDHLSKLQEQNGEEYEDAAEEVEDSEKRRPKASRPKKVYKGNRKKRKVEETYPLLRFTSTWLLIIRVYKL